MSSENKRRAIPKSTRFEVFKRDSFKCQYCGRAAPEIVLVVDHIKPVASGGTNDIINLITACPDCNSGKGARELSDQSAITKQRDQLEELNERREQLEMMVEWRSGMVDLQAQAIAAAEAEVRRLTAFNLNDRGRRELGKAIREFGLSEILEALQISADSYLEWTGDLTTQESVERMLKKYKGVARNRRLAKENPELAQIIRIKAAVRKHHGYINEVACEEIVRLAMRSGVTFNEIFGLVYSTRSWSQFYDLVYDLAHGRR